MRFVILAAAAVLAGCGYVGDPLPPALNIPQPVSDLRVVQRADKLILDYTAPALTTEALGITALTGAEAQIGDRTVTLEIPKPGAAARAELPAREWVGSEVAVRVVLSGPKGRRSEISNIVTLRVAEPLRSPSAVKAEPHPDGVRVSWTATDPRATKYRVTRVPEASTVVDSPELVDRAVELGKAYSYSVVALSETSESLPSEPVSVTSKDNFPPAPPANMNAIAGVSAIELAWDTSASPDLQSYRLYRDDQLLAGELQAPSYSDKQVKPGQKYRYAVSAMDQAGNESARSAAVEITAP